MDAPEPAEIAPEGADPSAEPATGTVDDSSAGGEALAVFDEVIELVVPARVEHLRLARLAAAGVASGQGFDVDALEELRIGVDELAAALVEAADDVTRLRVRFFPFDGTVEVRGQLEGGNVTEVPTLHRVAEELLGMVADEYGIVSGETGPGFVLRKSPRAASAG